MTARAIELQLSGAIDAGFEISGELVPMRQQIAAAIAYDDQEQPLISRINSLVMACTCGVGDVALPLIRHREALDKAQRAATEKIKEQAWSLTGFTRRLNGFLERAADGFRSLMLIGRWTKGRSA